jgi:hypothetical protein
MRATVLSHAACGNSLEVLTLTRHIPAIGLPQRYACSAIGFSPRLTSLPSYSTLSRVPAVRLRHCLLKIFAPCTAMPISVSSVNAW